MASATITKELMKYGIGHKLRQLRLRKSMGLIQLSKHTGLSPALLSKLERDVMHPTLPTLTRIAMIFNVGLEYFFSPEVKTTIEIVRAKERLSFPESSDARNAAYRFESLDFPVSNRALHCYLAEFTARQSAPHEHPGIEFIYVLAGKLELQIREESYELGRGDAVYFDSTASHAYRGIGALPTKAIVVSAPPRA
jgi:transcriptional regulator with XRE-family HTH domain